ncbi:MAG: hypothetical protein WA667_23900 [Candidatus Nitrosopolaris sp.]
MDDMLNYLLNIRKFQNHNARSLVNYFHRFRDIFFGLNPAEILKLAPHKKSWILQTMRHFGNYYNYKTNNPECKELIEKIIYVDSLPNLEPVAPSSPDPGLPAWQL